MVLLIEDEDDIREPNAVALQRAGYTVVQAVTWEHALALTEQHDVDVIVTDLVLPDRAGVATFAALRERAGHAPIIVFSAYPRVIRLLDGVLEGVVEWLQKPLEVGAIVAAVRRAIPDAR